MKYFGPGQCGVMRLGERFASHLSAVALAFFFCLILTSAVKADEIRSFGQELDLTRDGDLLVTEDISIDFQKSFKHGLRRFIPLTYDRGAGTYSLKLKLKEVTNAEGVPWHYEAEQVGPDFNIKIGDADKLVTGVQNYRIVYTVQKAVNFFKTGPELYWNVNGTRWPYPIDRCQLKFVPPFGTAFKDIHATSFVGEAGSQKNAIVAQSGQNVVVKAGRKLNPGECLTVVFGLPVGAVHQPTFLENLMIFLGDWLPVIVYPVAASLLLYVFWSYYGRDQKPVSAIGVEWTPPPGLTPAEVGTLIDESCDTPDVVSTLVDLAARGYLKIRTLTRTDYFLLNKKDYEFTKTVPAKEPVPLKAHENLFLASIFAGTGDVIKLSDLKGQFGPMVPQIRNAIWQELADGKMFARDPESDRAMFKSLAAILGVIGVVVVLCGGNAHRADGFGLIIAAVITAFSARAMPARTANGSQALARCKAFQRFVSTAEKQRIALLAKDDPTVFGRLLPYAMVLGAADKWAEAFKDLMVQPPDWYDNSSVSGNQPFSSVIFIDDLGDSLHSITSGFTQMPAVQSSGGGWGGGGFGGDAGGGFSGFDGGSSGGGFGGGGGDSW